MAPNTGIIGGRYRILRQLGRGGFGHTYLAEDSQRFDELCVLKEFNPQVEGPNAMEKAQQLFEREAGILYQLNHPQIPRFRELLRDQGRLYLVQDYIEGPSYQELLETRRQYSGSFSEAEVVQFLQQLLPVLQYIHSVGVIHRDIAPDNIIHRNVDGLPVLIDFGGVKQVVVNLRHRLGVPTPYRTLAGESTRLGKEGYAPEEQLVSGQADPSSDLYAVGVTALVLLTGKPPQELYRPDNNSWRWRQLVRLSPTLSGVIDRLITLNAPDRYQSAAEVMADLNLTSPYGRWDNPAPRIQAAVPPPPTAPTAIPGSYSPGETFVPAYEPPPAPKQRNSSGFLGALVGLLVLVGGIGGGWWWASQRGWFSGEDAADGGLTATDPEAALREALYQRAQELSVNRDYLVDLTDQLFYGRHPERQGQPLTDAPEDAELRGEWTAIANTMLTVMEENLSTSAREQLGRYNPADLNRWKRQVNQLYVSSRALYDLADAKFNHLFPQRNVDIFVEEPLDQIWFGLAYDRAQGMESGNRLSEIQFEAGAFSEQVLGSLDPGEGQVYILNLGAEQLMRVNLQAPADSTLMSLYVPSPTEELPYLLSDSRETTWSDELPQNGYYEIVVVSTAQQPFSYRLTTSVSQVIEGSPSRPAPPEEKD